MKKNTGATFSLPQTKEPSLQKSSMGVSSSKWRNAESRYISNAVHSLLISLPAFQLLVCQCQWSAAAAPMVAGIARRRCWFPQGHADEGKVHDQAETPQRRCLSLPRLAKDIFRSLALHGKNFGFLDAERTTPLFLLVNCKQTKQHAVFVVHPGCQMPCHLGATSTLGSRTGNSTKQDVMRVRHKAINLKTNWLPWDGKPSPKDSGKKLWLGKSRESWSWKQRDLVLLERNSGSTITGTLEPQMKNIEKLKKDDASKFESCLYSFSYIYLDCYKNLV